MKDYLTPVTSTAKISVGLIWLFHVSGLCGILFIDRELFLETTPINLFVTFIMLFVNQPQMDRGVALAAGFAFVIGFSVEFLGVNFGLIFGDYVYGNNLGLKIGGVPLLIGANWVMLAFITGSVAAIFFDTSALKAAVFGAFLMVLIDLVIEPVAPKFDFWEFADITAPLSNYIGWFLVAFPIQWVYQTQVKIKDRVFSFHLVLVQFFFFGAFSLIQLAS
ncbi:MAG: carotene biosynthesis protein [Flavobacteriaceae bacterium]|nr:carotene biosynthesis protein [Flavobacteriaceae bacterium]